MTEKLELKGRAAGDSGAGRFRMDRGVAALNEARAGETIPLLKMDWDILPERCWIKLE